MMDIIQHRGPAYGIDAAEHAFLQADDFSSACFGSPNVKQPQIAAPEYADPDPAAGFLILRFATFFPGRVQDEMVEC